MALAERHPVVTDARITHDADGRLLVDWGAGPTSRDQAPRQSVTRLVRSVFPPFDEAARLRRYRASARGRRDPRTDAAVLRTWNAEAAAARRRGQLLHGMAECRLNCTWGERRPTRAESVAFRLPAWQAFVRWFAKASLEPYRTELPMLDLEARVVGIADLFAVHCVEGDTLVLDLYDYKFGNVWDTPYVKGDTAACGLPNCNKSQYALALSVYHLLLEATPGPWRYNGAEYPNVRVEAHFLVEISDRRPDARVIPVPHYATEARALLHCTEGS
jgi:hypothetical protein